MKQLTIFFLFFLSICFNAGSYSFNDLLGVKKGATVEEVFKDISKEVIPPRFVLLEENIKIYTIEIHTSNNYGTDYKGRNIPVVYFSDFFFVFEDDQLLHWGFLYEFKISSDPEMNKFAKKIAKLMEEELVEEEFL